MNFGPQAAEICWRVWGIPVNFNGFRVLAALLHVTLVLGVSQTLRRWTDGDTYIRQGGHHVGHWPTFLVFIILFKVALYSWMSDRIPIPTEQTDNDPALVYIICMCCLHAREKF